MSNSLPAETGKAAVRRAMLAARRELPEQVRTLADAALVVAATDLVRGRSVAAYAPMPGEPGGPTLLDALTGASTRLLLPVLRDDLDLDWAVHDGSLRPVGRGLYEPTGPRLGPTAIATVDVILVPAVAVDRSGIRLGRGGGSYDRALARAERALAPAARVVVAAVLYDGEIVDRLPAEPHDRRVHAVLTPSGLISLGRV
jgi:5-formyltetrahydrofolate cyclo-ligase